VLEDDLDEEQGWVKAAPAATAQPDAASSSPTEPAQSTAAAPETTAPDMASQDAASPESTATDAVPVAVTQGGQYYVQVGAFSDLENANRALARLIAEGYKGSKLDATADGLYRVQAGAFADPDEAGAALERLQAEYPKGFVLKPD
jgi:cell division protein FtsN